METFKLKPEIHFGKDALERLSQLYTKRTFIVTDPFMVSSGKIEDVTRKIKKTGSEIRIFSDIVPDPSIEIVIAGVKAMLEFNPDTVVAIGGGSAIDAAKAICYFNQKSTGGSLPRCIAIPTTSGTGSEVTSFSIISDKGKGMKYPLIDDMMLPDETILDPELVKTVPSSITADTGMDVLTHALEAYVSTNATDFTDALAEKAISLVFENLREAYKDMSDLVAREKMHNASCLAGIAFNQASLGINHSTAHVIGAKFNVPHGRANAIMLPYVVEFNSDIQGFSQKEFSVAARKYAYMAKKLGLSVSNTRQGVKSLIKEIRRMISDLGMPLSLEKAKVDRDEFQGLLGEMAQIAINDRCTSTNPKQPTVAQLENIFDQAFKGR